MSFACRVGATETTNIAEYGIFFNKGLAYMNIIPYSSSMNCFYEAQHNLYSMTRAISMMMYAQ